MYVAVGVAQRWPYIVLRTTNWASGQSPFYGLESRSSFNMYRLLNMRSVFHFFVVLLLFCCFVFAVMFRWMEMRWKRKFQLSSSHSSSSSSSSSVSSCCWCWCWCCGCCFSPLAQSNKQNSLSTQHCHWHTPVLVSMISCALHNQCRTSVTGFWLTCTKSASSQFIVSILKQCQLLIDTTLDSEQ